MTSQEYRPSSQELFNEFASVTNGLLSAIEAFTPIEFNTVPFTGSWTAGQVAEHLYKSQKGLPSLLAGNSRASERPPDEKVGEIRSIFLDFNTKMQSPDFILPSPGEKEKVYFIERFGKIAAGMRELAAEVDLSRIVVDFPFPQMGELTRYEWLSFAVYHTMRHTRQMKNIHSAIITVK